MKVSFIVPVYKTKPEVLRKCLKSLFDQSYKEIEVITVFDGDAPELKAVVAEFNTSVLTIEHRGASAARNFGFKHATGDIIYFWDSDCYIEPDALKYFVQEFDEDASLDFVYSGYRFTDPSLPGFESEPLDPWTLERYNYICTMSPIRRGAVVEWDESLRGLQDWDFWRRVVKNGSKGKFIPGFSFSTEIPTAGSISGPGANVKERIEIVRHKYNDPDRQILINSGLFKFEAKKIAQILDADFFNIPYWNVKSYKLIFLVGFNPREADSIAYTLRGAEASTKKAIYWLGPDVDEMYNMVPFRYLKNFVETMNKYVTYHFCTDETSKAILADMGIKAEVLKLPRWPGEALKSLPQDFKILAVCDKQYSPIIDSVVKAMPDVNIEKVVPNRQYNLEDYTVALQFTGNERLEEGSFNMLLNGRYVLSNVQQPHAGYISPQLDIESFKRTLITKIRELSKTRELNSAAQAYYLAEHSPERFKEEVNKYLRESVTLGVI
jgi:glycosyltransferase involved in cell wall biosynthesis